MEFRAQVTILRICDFAVGHGPCLQMPLTTNIVGKSFVHHGINWRQHPFPLSCGTRTVGAIVATLSKRSNLLSLLIEQKIPWSFEQGSNLSTADLFQKSSFNKEPYRQPNLDFDCQLWHAKNVKSLPAILTRQI
ncbi:unnamed protein product [Allacma fusca]|uniref:Uncharacterized protein n=1 Tax=Allacma fusca TaxID=39272 RepID=A0A8J2JYI7_9HEXA|nr:unnamed protein product [Allacma fusca]